MSALARLVGVQVLASDWYQATGVSQLVGKVISATPDGHVQESGGAGATGMLRLLRQDPLAALAVVVAELFADPR